MKTVGNVRRVSIDFGVLQKQWITNLQASSEHHWNGIITRNGTGVTRKGLHSQPIKRRMITALHSQRIFPAIRRIRTGTMRRFHQQTACSLHQLRQPGCPERPLLDHDKSNHSQR